MGDTYRAGIIGCGGRGHAHGRGYSGAEGVEIAACADPVEESRDKFTSAFAPPAVYGDYREMLERENLDIVSVCTWPSMHREMIEAAAGSGVTAIFSEKPMAPTWGDCKALYCACEDNGVVLAFCHQRRFGAAFVTAKRLLDEGAIGDLIRLEGQCPDIFDWGTHWLDMFNFYNGETSVEWIMGQIDASERKQIFGMPITNCGLAWIRWTNGVEGLLATGGAASYGRGSRPNRLIGSEGVMVVDQGAEDQVRLLRSGSAWEAPALDELPHDAEVGPVADLVDSLRSGRTPLLSGDKALRASEMIFATFESSRRRTRVSMPLDIEDSPLISMIEEGQI